MLEYYITPINEPIQLSYWDRLYDYLHLRNIQIWYISINEVLYDSYPHLYRYYFTPIKEYVVLPTWNYLIFFKPINISYNYILHPIADGIQSSLEYIIHLFFSDGKPPLSPSMQSSISSDSNSSIQLPSSMSDSTETIRPKRTFSNNPFNNNGMFTNVSSSSMVKLEDLPDMNPFNS